MLIYLDHYSSNNPLSFYVYRTEAWPDEDTSIPISGPEQCDIWGPPLPPRMLFDPNPDIACPKYGYIPLDEEHSGSLANVLRWIKGVALSNLMNATFIFGGNRTALVEEVDLGLTDDICRLAFLEGGENLSTVKISLNGVGSYAMALDKLKGVKRKCGTVYKFEDPEITELGWTHLTLAHAVQKHIIDTKWKPTLWTTETFNIVFDMTGDDNTVDMEWVSQSLDKMFYIINMNKTKHVQDVIVIVNKESDITNEIKAVFEKYGKAKFVPKPKSVAEHVKHLVDASDIVFCAKLDADECHIAALAGSRPGFLIRVDKEDGLNFCPGAGMCSLVLDNKPITETNIAFVRGISERWNVGKFTKCL